jgi:hypothetical protein
MSPTYFKRSWRRPNQARIMASREQRVSLKVSLQIQDGIGNPNISTGITKYSIHVVPDS